MSSMLMAGTFEPAAPRTCGDGLSAVLPCYRPRHFEAPAWRAAHPYRTDDRLMTEEKQEGADAPKPKFRRSRPMAKMPRENARRQGAIVTLAFMEFGDRDKAVSFLNTHNESIDARPLDMASESSEGFDRVSDLITSYPA